MMGRRAILIVAAAMLAVVVPRVTHAADLRPEMLDHTPMPCADAQDLPEPVRAMSLPQGAFDRLTEVFASTDGPVRSVQIAWLSGDRYLWRVELAQALAGDQIVSIYIDADGDPTTGRSDANGADVMLQMGPDFQRASEWMADGTPGAARRLRSALDGAVVWLSYDHPLGSGEREEACRFWVNVPGGGINPIEAVVPGDGPQPLGDGALDVQIRTDRREGDVLSAVLEITNPGDADRWIDLRLPFALPFEGAFQWFDSFHFTPHEIGIAPIGYHGTSAVLPLTCAWDGEIGIALAFNPLDWYTELHSGIRPVAGGGHELTIGTRLAIAPGETERFEVLAFPFDGGLGWRGAFEAYWAMFPELYDRPRDIDPRFHQASAGGLYRSWNDPTDERFASDLIRRMHGHWEWGYAPAPRPGEWAVSELSVGEWTRSRGEVKKSLSAQGLPEVRAHIHQWVRTNAELADVAVAYYMHLKNIEKGLMEQYWSDSYFRSEPIEYHGYYQQVPCWFAYPWADSYGDYIRDAIPSIARDFEPAGIAFDSVFGFIPHWGPSADRSPGTTFDNGLAFVGEGIGFAQQMDVVRRQHTGGYRTAMVTNLKLPTLSADAVRTDCALLEFHPMSRPSYRERMLRLRMLSGRIGWNWWNTYNPKLYSWIPWDRLGAQQTIDAFRRLRDDVLIHSLYYGGYPNARFAVGIPKLMRALPMLIEVADLGWEPVVGAEPIGGELLMSRFGEGLGMVLGVGNQTYEPIEDAIVIDTEHVASGDDLVFMQWDGAETVTEFADGTRLNASVPPRDVRACRAVMTMPRGSALRAAVVADLHECEPSSMTIELQCAQAARVPVSLWLPTDGVLTAITVNAEPLVFAVTDYGQRPAVQADLEAGHNVISVTWQPRVALQGDRDALLNFPFVADGTPNCNVVAAGDTRDLAFRVQEYFREYHRWAVDEPRTVRLPIVTPEQSPDGRRIVIGLLDDLPAGVRGELVNASAAFGVQGDVVYATAHTREMLAQAVDALLFTLDERYEYWGRFFPTQNFFDGDPSDSPAALQQAGMAGKTLTGDDTGSLRDIMELPDLIVWP